MNGGIASLGPWDEARWAEARPIATVTVEDQAIGRNGKWYTRHRPQLKGTFPEVISVTDEMEKQATGPWIRQARDFLVWRLLGGSARYRLVARRPGVSLWRLDAPPRMWDCDAESVGQIDSAA